MQVRVLKKEGNEFKIEIDGAGHSICNLLQRKLLEDENVDLAGYNVPHPLAANPVIYVRMKGRANPEKALIRAIEKARKENREFSEELQKALKKA